MPDSNIDEILGLGKKLKNPDIVLTNGITQQAIPYTEIAASRLPLAALIQLRKVEMHRQLGENLFRNLEDYGLEEVIVKYKSVAYPDDFINMYMVKMEMTIYKMEEKNE